VTRILVVDDHEIMRQGTQQVLAAAIAGTTFGEARDASEAIRQLSEGGWDLVLLDLNIPGRDGLEILGEARALWPGVPFLVLTAYPEEELAVRCLRLGAAGYVTKSSAAAELVLAVKKVLSGGRYVTATLAERLAGFLGGGSDLAPHEILAPRELQTLRLIARGLTQKEIGAELGLSEKTVATYRARLAEKLGISRNAELVRYAVKHGLVD
jgi:DNA-binding NarL/FixJ family response regulator